MDVSTIELGIYMDGAAYCPYPFQTAAIKLALYSPGQIPTNQMHSISLIDLLKFNFDKLVQISLVLHASLRPSSH